MLNLRNYQIKGPGLSTGRCTLLFSSECKEIAMHHFLWDTLYLDQFSIFLSCEVCGTIILKTFVTLFSNTQKHAMHCIIYNRKKPVKTVVGKKKGGMLPNFFHHIQSPSEAVNRELCFAVFLSLP